MHSHSPHETMSLDRCAYMSRLSKWNPCLKLIFSMGAIVVNLCAGNPAVSLFTLFFMGAVIIIIGGTKLSFFLRAMKIPLVFIILGSIAIGFDLSDVPYGIASLNIGITYIVITKASLISMARVMIKAVGAVSAMYMVTLSTPVGDFISALKKMHLPNLFIDLMHLIYRYIFILLEGWQNITYAAQSRLGYVDYKTSISTFGKSIVNLLIVSLKKSGTYFDAMESRCFGEGGSFYSEVKKITWGQTAVIAVYICLVAAVNLLWS